jgi:3-phenylpropionate/trans-cinnamate dioxygenase ferredoxin subunit
VVARVGDIPDGGRVIVEAGGREIGVFNIDGQHYALRHRCPHLGGPLCNGVILGLIESTGPGDLTLDSSRKMLTCPWHGWEFDIKTGQSYWNPNGTRARLFPVEVQSGARLAKELAVDSDGRVPGPFVAEVIPVSIEDEYVVVTMRGQADPQARASGGV